MGSCNDNQSSRPVNVFSSGANSAPTAAEERAGPLDRRKSDAASSSARDRKKDRLHVERDVGIGYGTSHGYADDEHYAESWAKAPFRIG